MSEDVIRTGRDLAYQGTVTALLQLSRLWRMERS